MRVRELLAWPVAVRVVANPLYFSEVLRGLCVDKRALLEAHALGVEEIRWVRKHGRHDLARVDLSSGASEEKNGGARESVSDVPK